MPFDCRAGKALLAVQGPPAFGAWDAIEYAFAMPRVGRDLRPLVAHGHRSETAHYIKRAPCP